MYIILLILLLPICLISHGISSVEHDIEVNKSDFFLIELLCLSRSNEVDIYDDSYIENCSNLNNRACNIVAQNKTLEKYNLLKKHGQVSPDIMPTISSKKFDPEKKLIIYLKDETREKSPYEFLLPTLIGGALAILGSLITSYWNDRSQSRRSKFEWGKSLFEKYEKNYLDFKKTISGTTSAMRIEGDYRLLLGSSYVPRSLQISIEEAIDRLKEESLTDEEKKDVQNGLLDEFEKFIRNPWELT